MLVEILFRNQAINSCFVFPPHLTNASGKTYKGAYIFNKRSAGEG